MEAFNLKDVLRDAKLSLDKLRKNSNQPYKMVCKTSQGLVTIYTREERVILGLHSIVSEDERSRFVEALLAKTLENNNAIEVYEGQFNPSSRMMTVAVTSNSAPYEMHLY